MSETVGRKGKLILCKKYKDADELQSNLKNFWQSIPREERDKYYKDVEEIDDYEFITQFYNGSTDLQEMLQKGLDQTRKEGI